MRENLCAGVSLKWTVYSETHHGGKAAISSSKRCSDTRDRENPGVRMATLLQDRFDRLVNFPATTFPVLSLYLNAEPNQHGQDDVDRFLRRELPARGRTYEPHSADRESYDRDAER